ncbi:SseB family protein [bacterium 1XD8-76]|nr:SseB family protein [bacterium 1XD8-76]
MAEQNKEPVLHNEALEEAMKAFKTNQSNENLVKIMTHLEKATVMQPALLPGEVDQKELQNLIRESQKNPVKLEGRAQPRPIILKNNNGEQLFAVFTGKSQIPENQKYPVMMFLPFRECSKMAAREELKLSGIVLNPFTDNLTLHRAALEIMNSKEAQISAEDKIARDGISAEFYRDKKSFMDRISAEKESFVFTCYQEAYQKEHGSGPAFPYRQEDFGVIALNISDTLHMARIALAEGGAVKGACLCVFCCYNPQSGEGIYYLIWRGGRGRRNRLFTVEEGGVCRELGEAPEEGSELFELMGKVPWAEQS